MFTREVRRGGGIYTVILTRGLVTLFILVQDSYGCLYRRILRGIIPRFSGDDLGGPPMPHHIQFDGVISGVSLDIFGGKRSGRERRVGKVW